MTSHQNSLKMFWQVLPANIYLPKFNNRNIRKRCKICLKLTIKTPERHHELWTYSTPISSVSVANFVKVNVSWVTGCAIYLFVFSFNKFTSLFMRDQPITARCSLFIPPDNIRNPMVFWCFQGSGGWGWGGGGYKKGALGS